ncbi:Peroxiredoxin [Hyella patelloides LEGE 07179]|uniref:thioredoxin-dependent peroxiredoxin n=1 Tax=Hyella patelloides LEGE 07179 TaxID=945734 RepID=A0A563VUH6_9CYAN|nr:peroxiredoxin-like family protein [Hyella patelloides]VEP15039.1 Peroxiredoxin [Hyella patelloides LEGE 07179]
MNLTQELNALKANFSANQPETIKSVMAKATTDLINTKIAENSLSTGQKIPDFTLPNALGKEISLNSLLAKGAVVISFYRGGWCPYCNLELRALQEILPQIEAKGATLVAISPETPDHSLSTKEKNELSFEVLSDRANIVAKQLGLVFTLPESLRPIYSNFGIDIPAYNDDFTFELPLPATYVVAADGTVIYSFAHADYTQRLDPQEIINALDRQ